MKKGTKEQRRPAAATIRFNNASALLFNRNNFLGLLEVKPGELI
jgi:hypothetical protein